MTEHKIVCIGFGFLMEEISDNYYSLLGKTIADNMIATTRSEKTAEAKRLLFPFRIISGDNAGALRTLQPDIILFAPPPAFAKDITIADLVPYYEECRREGRPLPMLFAFPPAPQGKYYLETLGEDILVLNALPNPVIRIAGEKLKNEGVNFLTLPDGSAWDKEHIALASEFFAPTGRAVFFKPEETMNALGAGAVVNPLSMFIYTITDALRENGVEVDNNRIAEALRYVFRKRFSVDGGGDLPRGGLVSEEIEGFLDELAEAFFRGLADFLDEKGLSPDKRDGFLYPFGDLYLHSYMIESRETIEEKRKGQATKGGVIEMAVDRFNTFMAGPLAEEVRKLVHGGDTKGFAAYTRDFSYRSAIAIWRHSHHLDN